MKRIYWECNECGYFIDIDIVETGLSESQLLEMGPSPCLNPRCTGIMRIKIENDEGRQ